MTAVYILLGLGAACFIFAILGFGWRDSKISLNHLVDVKEDDMTRQFNKWRKRQRVAVVLGIVCFVATLMVLVIPRLGNI